jgi:hypothetical protein
MATAEQKPVKKAISDKMVKLSPDMTRGVLMGSQCNECGTHFFGAPRFCIRCTSDDLKTVELSKEGKLYTYTVVRQAPPGWQGSVPYILGSVVLPEGPHVTSEIIDCLEEKVKIDMPLEIVFRVGGKTADGTEIVVFKWRPKPV